MEQQEHNLSTAEKKSPQLNWSQIFMAMGMILIGAVTGVLGYLFGQGKLPGFTANELPPLSNEVAPPDQFDLSDIFPMYKEPDPSLIVPAAEPEYETNEQRIGLDPTSGYSIKYSEVYYQDRYLYEVDFQTAEYIGQGYLKDKNNVFYNGELVYGADPARCVGEAIAQCAESEQWKNLYTPYVLDVVWNNIPITAENIIESGMCRDEGFVVGTVENGPLAGGELLVQNENICGMWCSATTPPTPVDHFVYFNNYLIPINEATGFSFSDTRVNFGMLKEGIVDDENPTIAIDIPNSDYWLVNPTTIGFGQDLEQEDYLFTDTTAGSIYRSESDCFVSKRPDHIQVSYRLGFDYLDKSTGVLDVTMLDGSKNTEAYQFLSSYHACYGLVDEEWLRPDERLVAVGTLPNGDVVYKLADSQDEHLLEKYEDKNTLASYDGGQNKYTYDEYLSYNPFLYWKDPFGEWVQFMNRRFETAAEKCKPVVYLYPEQEGEFSVLVEPNGGFTKTIPEYGRGWQVTATPESLITDKKTGETYPYLYWSGVNTGIPTITEGWVVEKSEWETFLVTKLSQLGLNQKEIADFNEYWLDRFESEGADRYKIMFLPQSVFEPLAPLTVTGDETPATIIRVMMYAQPALDDETLPEQVLPPTPSRTGFTVTEWGGAMFN